MLENKGQNYKSSNARRESFIRIEIL